MPPRDRTVSFRAFGVVVRCEIEHECNQGCCGFPELSSAVDAIWPPGAVAEPGTRPGAVAGTIRIVCTGPAVQVSDGFGTTTTWVELADATHAADQAIRSTIAVEAPGRVFIHAGVVGVDGRAVVLPGRSMAGKTTLVAALLRAGADYLSDEYAVIDPDGLVHAYPRRLSIRGESGRTQVPAESLGATVPTAPLPIGLVAALVFDPQGTWSVTHGDQATCATTLIENAVAARHRPAEVLATAGVVARASAFAHGTRGETADAVARLLDLARQEAR